MRLKAPNKLLIVLSFMPLSAATAWFSCSSCLYCSLWVGSSLQDHTSVRPQMAAIRCFFM